MGIVTRKFFFISQMLPPWVAVLGNELNFKSRTNVLADEVQVKSSFYDKKECNIEVNPLENLVKNYFLLFLKMFFIPLKSERPLPLSMAAMLVRIFCNALKEGRCSGSSFQHACIISYRMSGQKYGFGKR